MRILIEVHHPAHIHFFKYPIRIWQERGHEVLVAGRRRGIMEALASAYEWIRFRVISEMGARNRFPLGEFLRRQIAFSRLIMSYQPHVTASVMGSYTQSAALFGVPNAIFTDSEHQAVSHAIAHPFATRIFTPGCFWKPLGRKQVYYEGYHELSFLRPEYFSPNPRVMAALGLRPKEYVLVRLSAWNTLHDRANRGIGESLKKILDVIRNKYQVLIVPEGELPEALKPLRLRAAPYEFHDVLSGARFVVTEGASTASEAACLGVPAVFVNRLQLGYLREQEQKYGLVFHFFEPSRSLDKIRELTDSGFAAEEYQHRRQRLLSEKIDVAAFVADEIERLGCRNAE